MRARPNPTRRTKPPACCTCTTLAAPPAPGGTVEDGLLISGDVVVVVVVVVAVGMSTNAGSVVGSAPEVAGAIGSNGAFAGLPEGAAPPAMAPWAAVGETVTASFIPLPQWLRAWQRK